MAQSYVHVRNMTGVAGMEGWTTHPEKPYDEVTTTGNPNIFVVFCPEYVRDFWQENGFAELVDWLDSERLVLLDPIAKPTSIWVKMY